MNVKMEEQSAINNDQLQVDRCLLNICRPKISVWSHLTWPRTVHGKDNISITGVVVSFLSWFIFWDLGFVIKSHTCYM